MGTGCEPIGSLQSHYRERAEWSEKKKFFSGLTGGCRVLVRGWFMFL
jgi:hypothetical protein